MKKQLITQNIKMFWVLCITILGQVSYSQEINRFRLTEEYHKLSDSEIRDRLLSRNQTYKLKIADLKKVGADFSIGMEYIKIVSNFSILGEVDSLFIYSEKLFNESNNYFCSRYINKDDRYLLKVRTAPYSDSIYYRFQERCKNDISDITSIDENSQNFNQELIKKLNKLKAADQSVRINGFNRCEAYKIDSINTLAIREIFNKYGYPGTSLVGEDHASIAALIVQHSIKKDFIELFPIVAKAYDEKEIGKFPFLIEQLYRFSEMVGLDTSDHPIEIIEKYNQGLRYPDLNYNQLAFIEKLTEVYPQGLKWKN